MGCISFLSFASAVLTSLGTATEVGRTTRRIETRNVPPSLTFTAFAGPLPLFPGEVTNSFHRLRIPKGPIAISEFSADIVEKDPAFIYGTDGGDEDIHDDMMIPVPLSEAYLHHHVVKSERKFRNHDHQHGQSRGVGFGAGTESRGTKQSFPYPYRFTTATGEDELVANIHIINTRNMATEDAHHCLECPCTMEDISLIPQRKTDHNQTCNEALLKEENDSCFVDKYKGGLYCCEDREFCLDTYYMSKEDISLQSGMNSSNANTLPIQSIFYLRYVIVYTPVTPSIHPLYLAACCDATGDESLSGNIEYDIKKCTKKFTTGDDCIHELETVQSLHGEATGSFGTGGSRNKNDKYVDVVYMVGHLHRGGISMSSYFMNGTELCISLPTYGSGMPKEIGNEPGYINSMSTCTFDPPLRMRSSDKIRVVGRYNSSEAHTGVMSLFYIAIADVDAVLESKDQHDIGGRMSKFIQWTILIALGCLLIGAIYYYYVSDKANRRRGYEPVPNRSLGLSS